MYKVKKKERINILFQHATDEYDLMLTQLNNIKDQLSTLRGEFLGFFISFFVVVWFFKHGKFFFSFSFFLFISDYTYCIHKMQNIFFFVQIKKINMNDKYRYIF